MGPVGEPGGDSFAGNFERKENYTWVLFLDPEDIKILSLGAIWSFGKGTGLSWTCIMLWRTRGPSTRPRCIRTIRAQTQCKLIDQSNLGQLRLLLMLAKIHLNVILLLKFSSDLAPKGSPLHNACVSCLPHCIWITVLPNVATCKWISLS